MTPTVKWGPPSSNSELTRIGADEESGSPLISSSWGSRAKVMYMYFDESGDFDFDSGNGSRYFLITCAVTRRPFNAGSQLSSLRFDLIEEGEPVEKLHACNDSADTRVRTYDVLESYSRAFRVYAAYVDKRVVPSEYRTAEAIYSKLFELLVDKIYESEQLDMGDEIIAITDTLPVEAKKHQVTAPLKKYMKLRFQKSGKRYELLHYASCSDPNLQAADYFCWAAQRDLKGMDWPLKRVVSSFVEVGEVSFEQDESGATP